MDNVILQSGDSEIPDAVRQAIGQNAYVPLPNGAGWTIIAEPTTCPQCRQIRALFILRQREDLSWICACWHCDDAPSADQLIKEISKETGWRFDELGGVA